MTEASAKEADKSEDKERVVYASSLSIPFCIGSIAVPLPLCGPAGDGSEAVASTGRRQGQGQGQGQGLEVSEDHHRTRDSAAAPTAGAVGVHRFTHRRYVYVRDGGPLAEDAFQRWMWAQTHGDDGAASEAAPPAVGQKRRRAEGEDAEGGDAPPSSSAFYSFVDYVVFVSPRSFPHPVRIVRSPPFVVDDLTYAEHPVEVWLHFRPSLGIAAPAHVVLQVLLEERVASVVPPLLAATLHQPKPLAMVVQFAAPANACLPLPASSPLEEGGSSALKAVAHALRDEAARIVVTERQDALRVFHPTWGVLRYYRAVLRKAGGLGIISDLRHYFHQHLYTPAEQQAALEAALREGEKEEKPGDRPRLSYYYVAPHLSAASGERGRTRPRLQSAASWDLGPFEHCIERCVAQRGAQSLASLTAIRDGLRKEREELVQSTTAAVAALRNNVELIHALLKRTHDECLALYEEEG